MDGEKWNSSKKRPNTQFKKKGEKKRGKWSLSSLEQSSGNAQAADTVYRILCPSNKIGNVIGKGGSIVKALREETQAKITVAESVPGSNERVITICSSPTKLPRENTGTEDLDSENEQEHMELRCAAQDALLKVHDRIIEEDLFGGVSFDDDNENNAVTARLLVPNNLVGCLLGKRGDVIQRLRSETGANIRVLPAEHLPSCAVSTDELVQISGKHKVVKKAIYEVSTLLHLNPRKDKPPLGFPLPYGSQDFHPSSASMASLPPPGNPMRSQRKSTHGMPPPPSWIGEFDTISPGPGRETLGEFSMKILCSVGKIGGVIGKGGINVKQLQQETGSSVHVEDAKSESDERVIRVSAFETLWSPRSQTIDAILQLQNKTSEYSERGIITTRLLVPSSKVGCILGQGGQVINEMRRRTHADIRVFSRDDKPECASEDEELVQVSGNVSVAKDALAEIASRLKIRTLRDANAGAEPAPVGRAWGHDPRGGLHGVPPSGMMGVGSSGVYEPFKGGGCDYEPQDYPPSAATGYSIAHDTLESRITNSALGSNIGAVGSHNSDMSEFAKSRVRLRDLTSGFAECQVKIRGSSEHASAAHSALQAFMTSGQNMSAQQPSSRSLIGQQSSYRSIKAQFPYGHQGSYAAHQSPVTLQDPYGQRSPQPGSYHGAYHKTTAQPAPYPY